MRVEGKASIAGLPDLPNVLEAKRIRMYANEAPYGQNLRTEVFWSIRIPS
jgi:hypothetical protein